VYACVYMCLYMCIVCAEDGVCDIIVQIYVYTYVYICVYMCMVCGEGDLCDINVQIYVYIHVLVRLYHWHGKDGVCVQVDDLCRYICVPTFVRGGSPPPTQDPEVEKVACACKLTFMCVYMCVYACEIMVRRR